MTRHDVAALCFLLTGRFLLGQEENGNMNQHLGPSQPGRVWWWERCCMLHTYLYAVIPISSSEQLGDVYTQAFVEPVDSAGHDVISGGCLVSREEQMRSTAMTWRHVTYLVSMILSSSVEVGWW